jgi:hypothetical protein
MSRIVNTMGAQGDLLVMRVGEVPASAKEEPCSARQIVAHSETGHHHVLEAHEAKLFRAAEPFTCYLQLATESRIVHERSFDTHETLVLGPGTWLFKNQREYEPEGWRRVHD